MADGDLGFYVTVKFKCHNMIDWPTFRDVFKCDPREAWKTIADGDPPYSFGDIVGDPLVTVFEEKNQKDSIP
jgi:hypothetical protein